MSSALKSSNISSGFVLQAVLKDVIEGILFLEAVLIRSVLEWSTYDWTIKSIACLVSELDFLQMVFWQYLCNVTWTSVLILTSLWLFHYHILRLFFSINMTLIHKKRFYHAPKNFIWNIAIFKNILKIFLSISHVCLLPKLFPS